ncbi:hypothetical protein J3R30DRAFT_3445392 [Lentinula aciculospora]|uniref:Uncharacterized protein n=1 Tax=Lentinula aciculospora TaxID=153920 RepID=A0A9W9AMN8_9AGAR|nr:hypothetical protein J3R30DRAFT_3445392 [Lentinula aciculospora]
MILSFIRVSVTVQFQNHKWISPLFIGLFLMTWTMSRMPRNQPGGFHLVNFGNKYAHGLFRIIVKLEPFYDKWSQWQSYISCFSICWAYLAF